MPTKSTVETEIALQRMVTIYVVTGLLFLVLPGTFLGVWNLVSISGRHSLAGLSQAWLQAHGHAQIFGWIGTFVIGIGYYSLSKMGGLMPVAVCRAWTSWAFWTGGVTLRWVANVTEFQWRALLPVSAAIQLIAFAIFFVTVSHHKSQPAQLRRAPMTEAFERPPKFDRGRAGSTVGLLWCVEGNGTSWSRSWAVQAGRGKGLAKAAKAVPHRIPLQSGVFHPAQAGTRRLALGTAYPAAFADPNLVEPVGCRC